MGLVPNDGLRREAQTLFVYVPGVGDGKDGRRHLGQAILFSDHPGSSHSLACFSCPTHRQDQPPTEPFSDNEDVFS